MAGGGALLLYTQVQQSYIIEINLFLSNNFICLFGQVNALAAGLSVFNLFLYTSVYTPLKEIMTAFQRIKLYIKYQSC
jgi:heme O synthase-like polyprenyltransferase